MTPIDTVTKIPHSVPIVFITSECDIVVPKTCTQNLIDRLRESGHYQVYHCELRHSSHDGMSIENEEDQLMYCNFMDALY